jgi:hypothetical protein
MSVVMDETGETSDGCFEFETTIRGRRVRCRLEDGRLRGDRELLDRLGRFDPSAHPADPVALAALIHDAVGSEVTIRVQPPQERPPRSIRPRASS